MKYCKDSNGTYLVVEVRRSDDDNFDYTVYSNALIVFLRSSVGIVMFKSKHLSDLDNRTLSVEEFLTEVKDVLSEKHYVEIRNLFKSRQERIEDLL